MGHKFADIMFSPPVRHIQEIEDSRKIFERWESKEDFNHLLTEREINFLTKRESFYVSTVSPDGWPYIQHRGGQQGFIKVLDQQHIGFADFRGNRQYITTGNLKTNNRIACFFMDYQNKRRLKLLGQAQEISINNQLFEELIEPNNPSIVERGFIIQVKAFDWNCPQHIPNFLTPNQ